MRIVRTDSSDAAFQELVTQLDAELRIMDGADNVFYSQFNKIAAIKHALVIYDNDSAVGCGAIKEYQPGVMEVKRMYTLPDYRGKGIAVAVLTELEKWAKELGYTKCILETGKRQPAAIALYKKSGYRIIANYGQYEGIDNSVCFEKPL